MKKILFIFYAIQNGYYFINYIYIIICKGLTFSSICVSVIYLLLACSVCKLVCDQKHSQQSTVIR